LVETLAGDTSRSGKKKAVEANVLEKGASPAAATPSCFSVEVSKREAYRKREGKPVHVDVREKSSR